MVSAGRASSASRLAPKVSAAATAITAMTAPASIDAHRHDAAKGDNPITLVVLATPGWLVPGPRFLRGSAAHPAALAHERELPLTKVHHTEHDDCLYVSP
jgi:hypothetical protein